MYIYIYIYIHAPGWHKTRPAVEFVAAVDWWGLLTRPEWALAPIGVLGLPNWVLGCTHGLRASAWALGAGIQVPPPALREWADG